MAVLKHHFFFLLLFFVAVVLPFCYCQSSSGNSQNIETFYPFQTVSPPAPSPPKNGNGNSTESPQPSPVSFTQNKSNKNKNVVVAVAVTAASTFVVATLLFFFGWKAVVWLRRRREGDGRGVGESNVGSQPVLLEEKFTRVDGNVKGLIVDENGLDVLYWKRLEGENQRNGLHRDGLLHIQKEQEQEDDDEEEEEEDRVYKKRQRSRKPEPEPEPEPVQKIPLLRGKSSSSHIIVVPEISSLDRVGDTQQSAGYNLRNMKAVETPSQISKRQAPTPEPTPTTSPAQPSVKLKNKQGPPTSPPPPAPPLPPIVQKKIHSPPAPPPPKVAGVATSSKLPPVKRDSKVGESSTGSTQVKLKPLHWDKVNKNTDHSMVWDKIDGGSFRFDNELMEALFGTVATNRKSPRENNSRNITNSDSKSPRQIFILDSRKSQNIAIVVKSLAISRQELLDALHDGQGLDADTLEKLRRIAITKEEEANILAFKGDPMKLADAESFLFHLIRAVPSAFVRLNAMFFRSNYNSEIVHFKDCLQTLELACKELRSRGIFGKLLEAVLKAGNRMNAGTSRGNAQAFKLTSLQKLSDIKSIDGKTTLLHFVVEEVVRSEGRRCVINHDRSLSRSSSQGSHLSSISSTSSKSKEEQEIEYIKLGLPIVGGLSSEFTNVKTAAEIDYQTFANTCTSLAARAKEAKRQITSEHGVPDNGEGKFTNEMKGFLDAIEVELKDLREEQTRITEIVKRTTNYYQPGAYNYQENNDQFQLFVIIKDFLNMVDQVCVEIARNQQKNRRTPNQLRYGS